MLNKPWGTDDDVSVGSSVMDVFDISIVEFKLTSMVTFLVDVVGIFVEIWITNFEAIEIDLRI